ncbi:conserved hypothetical protein [Candidatus Desulfarcum epimagneticum]|uniref:Uncharacterized protein n=1 Tax=uncultured Desulfobacteraceae bacterium TaxID=218296 RepID=A0A484HIV6_9BACT|nr:conserved hypothetical protein [uncultured Desulfobacteraceae bacterium]
MGSELRPIKGVNFKSWSTKKEEIAAGREIEAVLLAEGAEFREKNPAHPPWLAAREPFSIPAETVRKIERVGRAVFSYFDALQKLYPDSRRVRRILDIGVADDLKGLDPDKKLMTFRFDMILENEEPQISEVEEVYSSIGFTHAIHAAYGMSSDSLYEAMAGTGVRHILADEKWADYIPELSIMQKRLRKQFGIKTDIGFFSDPGENFTGPIYRFSYMRSFEKLPPPIRKRLIAGDLEYINPLFHGFSAKAAFALLFDDGLKTRLENEMGPDDYDILKKASPPCRLIRSDGSSDTFERLMTKRRGRVIKVVHSPNPDDEWGARGVFFGKTNKNKWTRIVTQVLNGRTPHRPEVDHVTFMETRFVESDRYDIPFFDPVNDRISLMTNARILLRPIFFRRGDDDGRLVSATATFVNTSKKVHWGRHAVLAPLKLS